MGGVTDSGTAYQGHERVGINTFPTTTQLTSWIAQAADFGVVPLQKGKSWVIYKATDQTAKGCN
jgi:hypothetical protein